MLCFCTCSELNRDAITSEVSRSYTPPRNLIGASFELGQVGAPSHPTKISYVYTIFFSSMPSTSAHVKLVDDNYRYPPVSFVRARTHLAIFFRYMSTSQCIRCIVRWHISVCFRYRCQVVLLGGRVRGAMLIGDTGLEETFENLILSGTNVSDVGADLLSLDVDVEDFFD